MRRRALLAITLTATVAVQSGCRPRATQATPAGLPSTDSIAPNISAAAAVLTEFDAQCRRLAAHTWRASLCGPLVLVEPQSRLAIANRPDPLRRFEPVAGAYVGTLTGEEPLANTAVDWHDQRWAMVMLPVPIDTFNRLRLLAHESFHRIQPTVGVPLVTPINPHLEERDARLWLRLELRALARAVGAPADAAHDALADALLFRAARHRLYPGSDTLESQLELGEGIAEYAGVGFAMNALGRTPAEVLEWSRERFERTASFARSLGYGTGPALGLALDRFVPGWHSRVRTIRSLSEALAAAIEWSPPPDLATRSRARAAHYGYDRLAGEEDARASERAARLAEYRARLIDGPVVVFRQRGLGGAYNPNTVVPLGDAGTVYPTRTFTAEWGTLTVTTGGALVSPDNREVRVAAPADLRMSPTRMVVGPGWQLELAAGWTLDRAPRIGDWETRQPTHAKP